MKIKMIILCGLLIRMMGDSMHAEGILKIVTDKIGRPEEVLELGLKERQERLEALQKEKAQLEAAKPAFTSEIQQKTNNIEKRLAAIKEALKLEPDNDFLIKTQSLLNDWFQVLKEQQKTQDVIVSHH